MKKFIFLLIIITFLFPQSVWASAAAKKRSSPQKKMAQQRQAMMQKQAVQMAIQRRAAQEIAARQGQVIQQQVVQQAIQREIAQNPPNINIHSIGQPTINLQSIGQPTLNLHSVGDPTINVQSEVQEIVSIDQIYELLQTSSDVWPLIIDQPIKESILAQHIDFYRQKGIQIQKSPQHYAELLDGMSAQNPTILQNPFTQVLQTLAVIEYDFGNGQNKDSMAMKILGQKGYEANKKRLGIR